MSDENDYCSSKTKSQNAKNPHYAKPPLLSSLALSPVP